VGYAVMTEEERLLEVADVSIAFGGNQALDQVSMHVSRGEVLGLIGPNGSGKTTLMNVIGRIYRAQAGSVMFQGRTLDGLSTFQVARAGIARTFQVPRVFPHMTALENMLVPGFATRAKESEDRGHLLARARNLLAFLEIERLADELAEHLSGGQRMLLQFARALMLKPRLMLLDEPFAGVHPMLIQRMLNHIGELHRDGIDFIVVSHDLPTIMELATRMVVLSNGRKIADGPPEAVRHHEEVVEAYLGV
jgi:ABC-type branched-subunit amino acid transport system ATPase component